VGRYGINSLKKPLSEFMSILGDGENSREIAKILHDSFENSKTYNDFVLQFLHFLTREYGLIIINMDNKELKRLFVPIMKKEIVERKSEGLIVETQKKTATNGI
jgi:uncharacterized protein YllA (UPF0747 family)